MIWAMAKDRKSKKEKKVQAARRKNRDRKRGKKNYKVLIFYCRGVLVGGFL